MDWNQQFTDYLQSPVHLEALSWVEQGELEGSEICYKFTGRQEIETHE